MFCPTFSTANLGRCSLVGLCLKFWGEVDFVTHWTFQKHGDTLRDYYLHLLSSPLPHNQATLGYRLKPHANNLSQLHQTHAVAHVKMVSQTSQLVKLPRELLDNVTSSLPTQDFNALRLACKDLETQLFEYWVNCFFKKRQFSKQS